MITTKQHPAYMVNGVHRFYNRWTALEFATKHRTRDVKFDLWNDVFRKQDWTKNPETSWETLLDMRARQIAAKGRPIVMLWSGGTDSYTAYEAFRRCRIHIDAFMTKTRPDYTADIDSYKWLEKNHYEPTFHSIVVDNTELANREYSDPYWAINKVRSNNIPFAFNLPDPHMMDIIYEQFPDAIIVGGFEKPHLLLENNTWYAIGVDLRFTSAMPPLDVEYFFISPELPELHIKQCWMLKVWLEQQSMFTLTEKFVGHDLYNPNIVDYYLYARACGRSGDLANSREQKFQNHETKVYYDLDNPMNSRMTGRGASIFNEGILQGDKNVISYIENNLLLRTTNAIEPYWFDKDLQPVGIITEKFDMGRRITNLF